MATLTEQLAAEKAAHEQTQQQLSTTQQELNTTQQQLSTTQQDLLAAEESRDEALDLVEQLSQQLQTQQEKPSGPATVEHNGRTFEVAITRFVFERKEYHAADVMPGSPLLARLVDALDKRGVAVLREVTQ